MVDNVNGSAQAPGFYKFKVGQIEVIALNEGYLVRDRPVDFVPNATYDEVGEAYAAAGMARDKLTVTFNALAVRTGEKIILIDTGLGEFGPPTTGRLLGNLEAAGILPGDVTTIVISHFHGDHILGLTRKDGQPTFPNAEIFVPDKEWDFWMDDSNIETAPKSQKDNFGVCRKVFGQYADTVKKYAWDSEIVPGLTSVRADGHTPGMSAIRISSDGETMMFVADITNNPLVFLRHPEWIAAFDGNGAETVATRKRILDLVVAEKLRVSFYHAPFPAMGFVAKNSSGYEFLPALWTALG